MIAVLSGFVALVWGADRFVMGAAGMAKNFGLSPLLIGLTIVAFGTSAPEMLVSSMAAFTGNPGLGVGNAIGSNITNIGLVLGAAALVRPLTVHSRIIRREVPVLLLTMTVAYGLIAWDGQLGRLDGALLIGGLFLMLGWVVREGLQGKGDEFGAQVEDELPPDVSTPKALLWFAVGLVVLLGSSRMLVWGAVVIARHFGVTDNVIGLTVVAFGTSLPELAASIAAARRDEHDIAVGNVIGSNMFNLLGVLSLPGLIRPGPVAPEVLTRDFPAMFAVTLLALFFARGFHKKGVLTRVEGGLLVASFCGYICWLYFDTRF
ncbi:MAG: calcium/sodium antiporter [Deltaproteobacteria bacterium]|nr:calcium/sodium antiporter [Deltaproteobacteria bacterium]